MANDVGKEKGGEIRDMYDLDYLMESEEEVFRLETKTDSAVVEKQALWAGIKSGMRVADMGCGSGKTTAILHKLVQPRGTVVGVDGSERRIEYAREHYGSEGIEFVCKDIRDPFDELGVFDFVWVRFILEYHSSNGFEIVQNISRIVKPGGILCLIDLDHNGLSHFGLSERLERTIFDFTETLEKKANFDPYAGRKSYSYLYKLGYENLDVHVEAHHLIFGKLTDVDAYNWIKKITVASKKVNFEFREYKGRYEEFMEEFMRFFTDPGRFTYTPVISVRGCRPAP